METEYCTCSIENAAMVTSWTSPKAHKWHYFHKFCFDAFTSPAGRSIFFLISMRQMVMHIMNIGDGNMKKKKYTCIYATLDVCLCYILLYGDGDGVGTITLRTTIILFYILWLNRFISGRETVEYCSSDLCIVYWLHWL